MLMSLHWSPKSPACHELSPQRLETSGQSSVLDFVPVRRTGPLETLDALLLAKKSGLKWRPGRLLPGEVLCTGMNCCYLLLVEEQDFQLFAAQLVAVPDFHVG